MRRRVLLAVAAGLAWFLLWRGLDRLDAPPYAFWATSALLLGPVLAFLARSWTGVAGFAGAAVALAVAATLALHRDALGRPGLLALALGVDWLPALAVAAAVFAWRRRSGV